MLKPWKMSISTLCTGVLALGVAACDSSDDAKSPSTSTNAAGSGSTYTPPAVPSPTMPDPTPAQSTTTAPSSGSSNSTSVASGMTVAVPQESPWGPGTSFGVRPYTYGSTEMSICTASFSFTAPNKAGGSYTPAYAVTAGHCGEPGDDVYALDANDEPDYSQPVGRFVYSSLQPSQDSTGMDWAILEIKDTSADMSEPSPSIPTNLAMTPPPAGVDACQYGATTGEQCGYLDSAQTEMTRGDYGNIEVMWVNVCARPGDSGGPNYATVRGEEVIVGITDVGDNSVPNCQSADQEFNGVAPMWKVMDELTQKMPDAYIDTYSL